MQPFIQPKASDGAVDLRHRRRLVRIAACACGLLSASLGVFAPLGSRVMLTALMLACAGVFYTVKVMFLGRSAAPQRADQTLLLLATANLTWQVIFKLEALSTESAHL